ncbi:MAG: ATP-binding protein [Planctomycetes bacterium]|nr:ATP-binding protein [Planctomycetota bacterium]
MTERLHTDEHQRELAVLHLSDDPNESFLLREELVEEALPSRIDRVFTTESLRAELAARPFDLLIVDLPLPAAVDPRILDELSNEHPALAIVFRWGVGGEWVTEAPGEQLGRSVRHALELRPDRPQGSLEREQLMRQVVRHRQAFLELTKIDLDDFDAALRRITTTVARVLEVARVSVWELTIDESKLHCLDLFDTRGENHSRPPDLGSFPNYLASLKSSLIVAAHDAQNDPRTSEFRDAYLVPLGITAMLDAPIRRHGRVVGVVCHEHVGEALRRWTVLEQCAASTIASLVARALEVRDRRALEARAARLERFEVIGTLAGGVAHDLNNLLTVLLGNLELAQAEGASGAVTRSHVSQARDAALAIRWLTNDLLAVGRRNPLVRRPLELRGWLARQEPLMRAASAGAGVVIDAGRVDVWVEADEEALGRVLLNLIRNAAEASRDHGAITVLLGTRSVHDAAGDPPPGAYASLSVLDEGVGMSPETQRRLFEPFFSTKSSREGHGLGLATAFGLVRQHGGTIRVDSELGRGSRFDVLLPLARGVG